MIRNLNPRPDSLLPLVRVSSQWRVSPYLFPDAVPLWIVPAGRKEPWRQVMHLALLYDSVPKNPTICEDKHVFDALRMQRMKLLAFQKLFERNIFWSATTKER